MAVDPKTHTILSQRMVKRPCIDAHGKHVRDPLTGRTKRDPATACDATEVRETISQKKGTQHIRGRDTGKPFLKTVDMDCLKCGAEWFYL